jgi:hypothetical protein
MDFNFLLGKYQFIFPKHNVQSAWTEHVPFSMWLIEKLNPRVIVELGTHYGMSYLSFCQIVKFLGYESKCVAIDHWLGEDQAGSFTEDVFNSFVQNHQEYSEFSSFLRMDFSEGLTHIEDNTIELISIDGHHSYESVFGDFKNALPKINKNRGVVLFHDVNEYQEGFGVSRFWTELKKEYEHFEFFHGHGLGVLFIGKDFHHDIESLINTKKDRVSEDFVQNFFQLLGQRVSMKSRIINLIKSNNELMSERINLIRNLDECRIKADSKNQEVINLYKSRSFRVTSILRRIGKTLRSIKNSFKY